MRFEEFNLNEQLLEAIYYMNFEEATPIQEKAIPEVVNGKDLIACAQTGTGKTAAFVLPILNKLANLNSNKTKALIIVPTRELAIQIDREIQGFSYFVSVHSTPVYGGGDGSEWEVQKKALVNGTNIIVATPGKLISHLNMGYVKFNDIEFLVLDEADRMLDMGFHEDIQKIITYIPKKRQTLMFSATMPPKIRTLASKTLHNPVSINIALSKPAEGVLQAAYLTYDTQKVPLVKSLIADKPDYKSILVFSSTKKKVFEIVKSLKGGKYSVEGISSDLMQKEREEVLQRFRSRKTRVLIATDVLSRGIDIKDINLVINFDVPNEAADYVHRVGRTARAETTGVAITLINENDMFSFSRIEALIEREVPKIALPLELGEGPQWRVHHRKPGKSGGNFRNKGKGHHHSKGGGGNQRKGKPFRNKRRD